MIGNFKIAVLQTLAASGDYLSPQNTLYMEANLRLAKQMSWTEFLQILADFEQKRRVVSQRDEDGNLKWKITDNGRARLAELVT